MTILLSKTADALPERNTATTCLGRSQRNKHKNMLDTNRNFKFRRRPRLENQTDICSGQHQLAKVEGAPGDIAIKYDHLRHVNMPILDNLQLTKLIEQNNIISQHSMHHIALLCSNCLEQEKNLDEGVSHCWKTETIPLESKSKSNDPEVLLAIKTLNTTCVRGRICNAKAPQSRASLNDKLLAATDLLGNMLGILLQFRE